MNAILTRLKSYAWQTERTVFYRPNQSVLLTTVVTVGTLKMRDLKMRHQTAGVENAGLENAGNDIVWNAAHFLCLLSFAGSKR